MLFTCCLIIFIISICAIILFIGVRQYLYKCIKCLCFNPYIRNKLNVFLFSSSLINKVISQFEISFEINQSILLLLCLSICILNTFLNNFDFKFLQNDVHNISINLPKLFKLTAKHFKVNFLIFCFKFCQIL